jgi:hypothetical protein
MEWIDLCLFQLECEHKWLGGVITADPCLDYRTGKSYIKLHIGLFGCPDCGLCWPVPEKYQEVLDEFASMTSDWYTQEIVQEIGHFQWFTLDTLPIPMRNCMGHHLATNKDLWSDLFKDSIPITGIYNIVLDYANIDPRGLVQFKPSGTDVPVLFPDQRYATDDV